MKKFVLIGFLLLSGTAFSQDQASTYPKVYSQPFDKPASINDFVFTQPARWLLSGTGAEQALEFTGKSDYEPPVRSPHTIGLIRDLLVGDFVLEADLLQTGREYGHRDMVIVFAFQDSSHFYYAHVASAMDDNAHQTMIVNGQPRAKITLVNTKGVNWGNGEWHRIRVERTMASGVIRVFFDGTLIQESKDSTFGKGYIGFGSFDDSGKIDNIQVWSPDVDRKATTAFAGNR